MKNQVAIFATLQAVEGRGEELEAAVLTSLDGVADEEGTQLYVIHRGADAPDVVRLYELYRDSAAKEAHMSGAVLRELGRALKGLLAQAPDLVIVPVVGGKGL